MLMPELSFGSERGLGAAGVTAQTKAAVTVMKTRRVKWRPISLSCPVDIVVRQVELE